MLGVFLRKKMNRIYRDRKAWVSFNDLLSFLFIYLDMFLLKLSNSHWKAVFLSGKLCWNAWWRHMVLSGSVAPASPPLSSCAAELRNHSGTWGPGRSASFPKLIHTPFTFQPFLTTCCVEGSEEAVEHLSLHPDAWTFSPALPISSEPAVLWKLPPILHSFVRSLILFLGTSDCYLSFSALPEVSLCSGDTDPLPGH